MTSIGKWVLGSFAAATLPASAPYSEEWEVSARQIARTTTPKLCVLAASEQGQNNFRAVDLSSHTPNYIAAVAKNNARRKNIVVAWGGTESLRHQVQLGLQELADDYPQIQIVMIEGPELNGYEGDIQLDYLPKGSGSVFSTTQGIRAVYTAREDTYNYAKLRFRVGDS